jgi:transcriptional regulator with XRE-family HTH domain
METIGHRIKVWRRRRQMSQKMLADLAGLSQAFISQVESGNRTVERRSTLAALASALQVSAAELVGAGEPGNPVKDGAAAAVPAVREALITREMGETGPLSLPVGALDRIQRLGAEADYRALVPELPPLLGGCTGRALVLACYETTFALKYLGYLDLARDAAKLALVGAHESADPALIGVAHFLRAHALPTETADLAARIANQAAAELQHHLTDPDARQAYGMLHLTAALRSAVAGQRTADHLAEAAAEADSLGEPVGQGLAWMGFGPTNVRNWRVTIGAELGDVDEVVRVAENTDPRRLQTRRRQALYHVAHGHALTNVGGRDDQAVFAFLRAEEIAPQQVRLDQSVRDAVAAMCRRSRNAAVSRPLRRLAAALDVTA